MLQLVISSLTLFRLLITAHHAARLSAQVQFRACLIRSRWHWSEPRCRVLRSLWSCSQLSVSEPWAAEQTEALCPCECVSVNLRCAAVWAAPSRSQWNNAVVYCGLIFPWRRCEQLTLVSDSRPSAAQTPSREWMRSCRSQWVTGSSVFSCSSPTQLRFPPQPQTEK